MQEKKKKKWLFVVLVVIILFGVLAILGVNALRNSSMANPEAIEVGAVDISQVADGVYTGEAKNGVVKAEVSVTVESGAITGIQILSHRTGKGRPAEAITANVIDAQSLDVDAISSATLSSKTILQAIENALTGN